MVQISRITLIAWAALFTTGTAYAHHSTPANFDMLKTIKLTGVVVQYQMRSPHSHITMDVKNRDGVVARWVVESHAVGPMKRMGLDQEKLKPGDVVTVLAFPNRTPEHRLVFLTGITTADGTVIGGATTAQLVAGGQVNPKQDLPANSGARAGAVGIQRLTGRWDNASFKPTGPKRSESLLSLTRAGVEAAEKYDPLRSPGLDCKTLPGIPWLLDLPYLTELKMGAQQVVIRHEIYNITRTVPLNAKPRKADEAGLLGLVSGRIDGDALVVTSSNYPPSRWGLAPSGQTLGGQKDIPSSAQKKVTERYSVSDDGNTLSISYTVEDPVYLTKPYSSTSTYSRVPNDTPMEYKCDPDSATRYLE